MLTSKCLKNNIINCLLLENNKQLANWVDKMLSVGRFFKVWVG